MYKKLTVRQAFKLLRMLKVKQQTRMAWLGPSLVYSSRMDEIKANARDCLNDRQFLETIQPYEVNILKAILGVEVEKQSQK